MIIKGSSHTGRGLGAYLLQDKNDRAEVLGIRGDIPRDLKETIDDWRSASLGTNCSKPLYHAQLNPDRTLNKEEWGKAIEIFEKEMGFENQPRLIVLHEHKGREHIHLVYSRMDANGKALSDSWNYLHHEKAAREIEHELGLEHTQGALYKREGDRPERTPDQNAIQQGERLKLDPREVKAKVSALYQNADSGRAFVAALESEGYTLAKGDSRAYVILDAAGGVHSLSKVAGVKVADIKKLLQDYPLQDRPNVEEARELAQIHAQRPEQKNELAAPESSRAAFTLGDSAHVTRPTINIPIIETASQDLPSIEKTIENRAEVKDLERQAFAAQLAVGTLKQEPVTPTQHEAAAPMIGTHKEQGDERVELIGGAVSAVADGAVKALTAVLDLFSGDSKPPPTPEQQKAIDEREKRAASVTALEERLRGYDEKYKQERELEKKGKELDSGRSLGLDLYQK